MSFFEAFEALAKDNSTDVKISQIPTTLLESFIPGYAFVSKLVLDSFGIDITNIVSLIFVTVVGYTSARYVWSHAVDYFHEHFTSSVSLEDNLILFDCFIEWVAEQNSTAFARNLMVSEDIQSLSEPDPSIDQEHGWVNYRNAFAVGPTRYLPDRGVYWFFWAGHLFWMDRQQQTFGSSTWGGAMVFRNRECIRVSTIGRSTQPIKDLFRTAKDSYRERTKSKTRVFRPDAEDKGHRDWKRVAKRASRPIDTVILDRKQKIDVMNDINEYLHPATGRWYANRGIPYRRGYLFYGPPGAGKSSFAWAIAGVFGVDIYCISLADPNMTEDALAYLFSDLPKRCVVLLEDIDSAGLDKRDTSDITSKSKKQGVTLSGLLNVIDGVAAHEGHVLVMTTNFPDNLDAALIRPGRIDKIVAFTLATTEQMAELFVRMYSTDNNEELQPLKEMSIPSASIKEPIAPVATIADDEPISPTLPAPLLTKLSVPSHNHQNLEFMAQIFASELPTLTFSPAEIQGFLLTRKTEPSKALADVAAWRDDMLAAKAKKEHADQEVKSELKRGSMSSEKTEVGTDENAAGANSGEEVVAVAA